MSIRTTSKNLIIGSVFSTIFAASGAHAQLTGFAAETYEGLPIADGGTAFSDLGWQVGASEFDGVGTYPGTFIQFYGLFPAPNHDFGFSSVATGDATAGGVGTQYLNMYSDYNNSAIHGSSPKVVHALLLKEYDIVAADIGKTVTLNFDAKRADFDDDGLGGDNSATVGNNCTLPCTAGAFIKTLDPANGFSETNGDRLDTTAISQATWTAGSVTIELTDPLLVGQKLQLGFENFSSNYENSGVYYDNVEFVVSGSPAPTPTVIVPIPAFAIAGFALLLGFAGVSTIRERLK